jgi:hypothetical protein
MLQRSPDKWKPAGRRDHSGKITTLLAVNGLIVLVLIVLALSVPSASELISAAVQAEFVIPGLPTAVPTQMAQPTEQMRVVRSN